MGKALNILTQTNAAMPDCLLRATSMQGLKTTAVTIIDLLMYTTPGAKHCERGHGSFYTSNLCSL